MKLGSSTANGSAGILKFEWPIDDIIKIESCWCGTVSYISFPTLFLLTLWNGRNRGDEFGRNLI